MFRPFLQLSFLKFSDVTREEHNCTKRMTRISHVERHYLTLNVYRESESFSFPRSERGKAVTARQAAV